MEYPSEEIEETDQTDLVPAGNMALEVTGNRDLVEGASRDKFDANQSIGVAEAAFRVLSGKANEHGINTNPLVALEALNAINIPFLLAGGADMVGGQMLEQGALAMKERVQGTAVYKERIEPRVTGMLDKLAAKKRELSRLRGKLGMGDYSSKNKDEAAS